jgi:hypothetical protein
MYRLFALHAGSHDVEADFWRPEAPTSLAAQSEVDADGFGLAELVLSGRAEQSQAYERDD